VLEHATSLESQQQQALGCCCRWRYCCPLLAQPADRRSAAYVCCTSAVLVKLALSLHMLVLADCYLQQDGVSTLEYLRTIYPEEWSAFVERLSRCATIAYTVESFEATIALCTTFHARAPAEHNCVCILATQAQARVLTLP
jgi:hypothetical protein